MEYGNKKIIGLNVVFDLDGTLSKVNTYKVFITVLFIYLILTLQVSRMSHFFVIIYDRLRRRSTRYKMKVNFFELYSRIYFRSTFNEILHKILMLTLRKNLLKNSKIASFKILATAAYHFYSSRISEELEFDLCIATTNEDIDEGIECIGEIKKDRVRNAIGLNRVDLFFTDHRDDIPLIQIADKTFLIKPSKESQREIESLGLPFEIYK